MSGRLVLTRKLAGLALLAPPLALFLLFFVSPLLILLWVSVHGPSSSELYGNDLTVANYLTVLTDDFYQTIILRTLSSGLIILLLCLVLGYATAYVIAPLPSRKRLWMMLLLILPLLVSNVVRIYGWLAILGRQGLVNITLKALGYEGRPPLLLNSFEAVAFGMMTILLPYMVISVANSLSAIEQHYKEAAQSLRASPVKTFIHVTWPLSSPGVASGMLLVFLLGLSAYVTITLLGGPRMKLLVSLIFDAAGSFRWPLTAAISFVMLALALIVAGLIMLLLRPGRVQGRG